MNENEIKEEGKMFLEKKHLKRKQTKKSTCTIELHEEGDLNNGTE